MRAPNFKGNFKPVENCLSAVQIYLVGPFSVRSNSHQLYFLTIVDQYSGFKVVKFLREKFEAFEKFKEFKIMAEEQTNKHLKVAVSDGGGEFINERFKTYFSNEGIAHHVAPPYTPQNNGLAERTNQTILSESRCLLNQSKLPKSFWEEAVKTAAEISNLSLSKTREISIPYEVWHNKKADLDLLRTFGFLVYALICKAQSSFKLNPTDEKELFLGYENDFST